jgi:hypothetical protein
MKNDDRVHLRLPKGLKAWAVKYAESRHTSLTTVLVRLLLELKRAEERRVKVEADQV